MSNKYLLFFVALLLFALVQGARSLKCYTCMTKVNQECRDPFNVSQMVFAEECNDNQVCLKQTILPGHYMVSSEIKRKCVSEDYCVIEEYRSEHCSTCRTYLCNSGLVVRPTKFSLMAVFVLFLVCFD